MLRRVLMAGDSSPPPGNVDDFSIDTLSLYTQYGAGTKSIAGGVLNLNGGDGGQAALVRSGELVADGEVGVVINSGSDSGFVFRAQDANNYYLAQSGSNSIRLYRRVSGSFVDLTGGISVPATFPRKYHAILSGTSIKLYVDNIERVSTTDATFASGLCGPRSNSSGVFDSYFWP